MIIKIRNSIFNHVKDCPKPVKNKMGRKMLVQTNCIKVIVFSPNELRFRKIGPNGSCPTRQ
jgi:hypothetical protein